MSFPEVFFEIISKQCSPTFILHLLTLGHISKMSTDAAFHTFVIKAFNTSANAKHKIISKRVCVCVSWCSSGYFTIFRSLKKSLKVFIYHFICLHLQHFHTNSFFIWKSQFFVWFARKKNCSLGTSNENLSFFWLSAFQLNVYAFCFSFFQNIFVCVMHLRCPLVWRENITLVRNISLSEKRTTLTKIHSLSCNSVYVWKSRECR